MITVTEAATKLGVSRDKLHYLIKVQVVRPEKEGNRYLLTDEDIETVRRRLQEETKPSAAIMQLQVTGARTRDAVDELKSRFPQVVWAAGAWGEASLIALLEAPKLENIASVPLALGELDYIKGTKTSVIPSQYYYVKETPQLENERLAVILINTEKFASTTPRVLEDLCNIPEVRRWGALLGQWDAFAEVRLQMPIGSSPL